MDTRQDTLTLSAAARAGHRPTAGAGVSPAGSPSPFPAKTPPEPHALLRDPKPLLTAPRLDSVCCYNGEPVRRSGRRLAAPTGAARQPGARFDWGDRAPLE